MGKRSRKRRAPVAGGRRPVAPSRSEQKNVEARAKLEPLAPGERPAAVTVAAIVALLIGVGNIVAWLAGLEVDGEKPEPGLVLFPSLLLLVAAAGMWRARYWAVLGMQTMLTLLIVTVALAAFTARSVLGVVIAVVVLAAAGTLFWTLVKAMARIQMPGRG